MIHYCYYHFIAIMTTRIGWHPS